MSGDGTEIARVPIPPCRCGGTGWESLGDAGDHQCLACGTIYTVVKDVERVLNDAGVIERIHKHYEFPLDDSDDRRVLICINTGPDDQRPDHNPENGVYRPICVAQHLQPGSDAVYTYLKYCGHCGMTWGRGGHGWVCCPFCAATIGNYVFADGVEHWYPAGASDRPPKHWSVG